MDEITKAIREQYEDFPYPAGAPVLRVSTDARYLMSLTKLSRSGEAPIKVLDAGCGRGVGLLGFATLQPDVEFLGIDINRVALKEVNEQIEARGLNNVRVQEVNLMTLEGLEVPEGGFDVIYSSGVLHHLSDPVEGLRRLRSVLAPHGVISLMVYASVQRQPLYRLINATKLLIADDVPLREQIKPARILAEYCGEAMLKGSSFESISQVNDTEFVDMCLNPNETSYSVESMWRLLENTNMKFIQWSYPKQWSAEIFPEGELRERARKLNDFDLFRLVEQVNNKKLMLVISHEENDKRPLFNVEDVNTTLFAVNSEIVFSVTSRNLRTGKRFETLAYKHPSDAEETVPSNIAYVNALSIFSEQFQPFTGDSFIDIMKQDGIPADSALEALVYFLDQDVLYRPHLVDL